MLSSLLIVSHFHWSPTMKNLPLTKICRNIILSYLCGFPYGFHTKVVYVFLASPILTTCLAYREFTVSTVGSNQIKHFIERWTENAERIVANTCKASAGKSERNIPVQSSRRLKDDSKLHITEIHEVVNETDLVWCTAHWWAFMLTIMNFEDCCTKFIVQLLRVQEELYWSSPGVAVFAVVTWRISWELNAEMTPKIRKWILLM